MTGLTPDITSVAVVRFGVLRLGFADGLTADVDVLDRMRGPVFEAARAEGGFAAVAVDEESGTITWPGGVDFAPDVLDERARTARRDVAAWRWRLRDGKVGRHRLAGA